MQDVSTTMLTTFGAYKLSFVLRCKEIVQSSDPAASRGNSNSLMQGLEQEVEQVQVQAQGQTPKQSLD